MTFKAQAAADLPTFLNVDEFAETVTINGEAVACVIEGNGDTDGSNEGVIDVDTLLHARADAFYKRPTVGDRLTIDERKADVVGVNEEQGILELRLKWFDS